MSMKAKKIITSFLSILMLMMAAIGNITHVNAQQANVINPKPQIYVLVPGETTTLRVPVKAVGSTIASPIIVADASGTPYTITQPELFTEGLDVTLNSIFEYLNNQYIEFKVTVAETAKIGVYPIKVYFYSTGNDGQQVQAELIVNTQILEEKEPAQLSISNIKYDNAIIGKSTNLSFTVKNDGEITARNVFVSVDYGDTGMIAGYPTKNIKIGDIESQKTKDVKLPIEILAKAKPGINVISVNLSHKTEDGSTVTDKYDVYITLKESSLAPNIILDEFKFAELIYPGDKLGLVVKIKNNGKLTAYNPKISVDESSIGTTKIIKNYYTDYIELGNLDPNKTVQVEVPLTASKQAQAGLQDLKLNLVYYDEKGVEYKTSVTLFPNIEKVEEEKEEEKEEVPVIIVSNVKQSPQRPEAGGSLTVSFDIKNEGKKDLENFKIVHKNLAGGSFSPVSLEPYQYIGVFKAGETKTITMDFTVTENATEGLNVLSLAYSFTGGGDNIDIPVINVINEKEEKEEENIASKPKFIVSRYESDIEEIRAGSVFNFTFEVRNTHSKVAAKNIVITVSGKAPGGQTEIFSVTQGSNSFFVDRIGPGETYSDTLEMKVKSDAATAAYPITLTIDYEYDGIKANPATGEIGETVNHELLLQVVENARPVVNNATVFSYEGSVIVGSPATLSFEFYNMGKSVLNNVTATVEGDFTASGGNMYYIGNVNSGDRSYGEMEVIPNIEGTAKGVIRITYEDSNGNEQVYTKEFESFVIGAPVFDPGYTEGGLDVFNPTVPEPKKVILPTWAFILVQVVIFIIFVPVSRKVIINIYKSKLRKKEENMI